MQGNPPKSYEPDEGNRFGEEEKGVVVSIVLSSLAHLLDVDVFFRRHLKDFFSQIDA